MNTLDEYFKNLNKFKHNIRDTWDVSIGILGIKTDKVIIKIAVF